MAGDRLSALRPRVAADRHRLRVDLLHQAAHAGVSRRLRVAHVRPDADRASQFGRLWLEHQRGVCRGLLADGPAVARPTAAWRAVDRRRLFLEPRRDDRDRRHPGGRFDVDRVAGDSAVCDAPALRGLRAGGRLGGDHVPVPPVRAYLRLAVVPARRALLVPLALLGGADHADLRAGPRHGAGAGQLVVRPQCAGPVVHADRARGRLLLHSEGAGEADPQLLSLGPRLLVARHLLQLGGGSPPDRRTGPRVGDLGGHRREPHDGDPGRGHRHQPSSHDGGQFQRAPLQPDAAFRRLRGGELYARQPDRLGDGDPRFQRDHAFHALHRGPRASGHVRVLHDGDVRRGLLHPAAPPAEGVAVGHAAPRAAPGRRHRPDAVPYAAGHANHRCSMNRGPLIFLGIFFALAFSWTGVVLTNQIQYGSLTPYYDQNEGKTYPEKPSGQAERGRLVYQDLGCLYCHSQQVRRPGFGADTERGWGDRQSVARDYVYEKRVFLGTMRTGPDLRNIGARQPSADWHYLHLYDPRLTSPGSIMAPFAFLYEYRPILGERSPKALKLPAEYAKLHRLDRPGYELVPTPRAEALVAYLLSLKDTYEFPEAKPYVAPKAGGSGK